MGLLEMVVVLFMVYCAVVSFIELVYRIATEEDAKYTWKERAILALLSFLVYLTFLIWMKMEGWW